MKFFEQFTKASHEIRLTQAEKDLVRHRLMQFAVKNSSTDVIPRSSFLVFLR